MKRKQTSLEILTVTIAQHLLQSAQMSFALVLIPWKSWGRRIGNQSEQVQQFILYLYKILPAYLCIFVQLEHPEYHSIYIYILGAESKGNSRTCLFQFSLRFFRQEFSLEWESTEVHWEQSRRCTLKECKTLSFCCSVILCCKYVFACFPHTHTVWSTWPTAFYFASKLLKMGGFGYSYFKIF